MSIRPPDSDTEALEHFKVGNRLCDTKDWGEGLRAFLRALEKYPDWPEANMNLGMCYHRLKDFINMLKYYTKALRCFYGDTGMTLEKPGHACVVGRCWLLRAVAHLNLEQPVSAEECLRKGREILGRFMDDINCRYWYTWADTLEVDTNVMLRTR